MSRRTKILAGIAAALLLVTVIAAWVINRTAYGIPAFMLWKPHMSEFHGGQRAKVNGISVYYETYGQGRPVLLLHGAGAALEVMHYFISDLARDHRVIAIDSRGQGRTTDAPGPITYSKMGADMIGLLDALHLKQVDVIGWSDGGIVGLDMAMKHPTRVRRLIAIGANYTYDGVDKAAFSDAAIADFASAERPFYRLLAPDPDHFDVVFAKIVKMVRTEPNYTIADLGRIRCPTLIVAGEHDLILRKHTDSLAHAIPGAKEIIVPGLGHEGLLEDPAQYNKMARDFLDRP
jgi:pimeloyl-ACP methyl ester carboxylesterase